MGNDVCHTLVRDRRVGLPAAMSPRPSVHAIRLAGFASERVCGLERVKTTGRSTWAAMALTIASVKAPGTDDAPIRMVGRTRCTTSAKPTLLPLPSRFQLLLSAIARAYGA